MGVGLTERRRGTHAGLTEAPQQALRPLAEHNGVRPKDNVERAHAADIALARELAPRANVRLRAAIHLEPVRAQPHTREERDERNVFAHTAKAAFEVGELRRKRAQERRRDRKSVV